MTDPYDIVPPADAVMPPDSGVTADVMGGLVIRKSDGQVVPEESYEGPMYEGHPSQLTDGFHTMAELYEHRRALTAVLATIAAEAQTAWRSKAHHPDGGPMFDGYFIVGIDLPTGTISYHYDLKHWDEFRAVPEREYAPKWDGHTPADVVKRLDAFAGMLAAAVLADLLRTEG